MLRYSKLSPQTFRNHIRKVKLDISFDEDCDTINGFKGLYKIETIESLLESVKQSLGLNSSENDFLYTDKNMTVEEMKIAAEMFMYLNTCPGNLKSWFVFYKDLFETKAPDEIILTLNRIVLSTKRHQMKNDYHKMAIKFLKKTSILLDLKYEDIQKLFTGGNRSKNVSLLNNYKKGM